MNSLVFLEYEEVSYKVVSNPEEERFEDNTIFLTDQSIEWLEKLNEGQKFAEIYRKRIKFLNYVGVLKTENLAIELLPKFTRPIRRSFGEIDLEYRRLIMNNLLVMLSHTNRLTIKRTDIASLEVENIDFLEIFINIFCKKLMEHLRLKQYKDYVKEYDEMNYVRERIDVRKYCSNPAKYHKIPCYYHNRSMDNLLNRTLKYTTFLMSKIVRRKENYRLIKNIQDILEPVSLTPVSVSEINTISFSRLNYELKPFIDVCKVLINGSSLALQASEVEFFSLLIPMERLFEEFIANFLIENKEELFGPQVNIRAQESIGYLLEETKDRNRGIFNLNPDLTIKSDSNNYILDTKYKLLEREERNAGVSSQDAYQMHGYAKWADSIILLYPKQDEEVSADWKFRFESGRVVGLFVRTIDLSKDLYNDLEGFKKEMREIINLFLNYSSNNKLVEQTIASS